MTIPAVFSTCVPHPDVLARATAQADFAADLALLIRNAAPAEGQDAGCFFEDTYPRASVPV